MSTHESIVIEANFDVFGKTIDQLIDSGERVIKDFIAKSSRKATVLDVSMNNVHMQEGVPESPGDFWRGTVLAAFDVVGFTSTFTDQV